MAKTKIFYNLPNDIIEKKIGCPSLLDVLQKMKFTIYTELQMLRGEKIEIAYIMYSEQLLNAISEMGIRKISVFSKGDDDIIVPKNYVKYSSDSMISMNNMHNIILNNKNYKTENEIIITGTNDIHQDVLRNIYLIFGNVIMSTLQYYDTKNIECFIKSRNIPNSNNIYYNAYTALEGLKKCVVKKNIVLLRSNEYFSDLSKILLAIPNNDKIVTCNLGWSKTCVMKYGVGDHIIAGKHELLIPMYTNIVNMLVNKLFDIRKKLRLEYTAEQILAIGLLYDKLYFFGAKDNVYAKEIVEKNFIIIPLDEMGYYYIPWGNHTLTPTTPPTCPVKTIADI